MTYEEKRELRLQISQMLADAGLNQKVIKDMVHEEIKNKVERAVDQVIKSLNAECYSGDYIGENIRSMLHNTYINKDAFDRVVKQELSNRIVKIVLDVDEVRA